MQQMDNNEEIKNMPPSIWIPITLAVCGYILAILFTYDFEVSRAIYMTIGLPFSTAVEALGASVLLLIGVVHLVISQLFKSKRNSRSRRNIMIFWSTANIALVLFVYLSHFY